MPSDQGENVLCVFIWSSESALKTGNVSSQKRNSDFGADNPLTQTSKTLTSRFKVFNGSATNETHVLIPVFSAATLPRRDPRLQSPLHSWQYEGHVLRLRKRQAVLRAEFPVKMRHFVAGVPSAITHSEVWLPALLLAVLAVF